MNLRKDKKEKKDKKVTIIAGAVAVLIFLCVGVTLYLRSDGYQYKKNMKLAEENFEAEEYKEALFYYKEARKILKRGLKNIEEEESIDILHDKIVEVICKVSGRKEYRRTIKTDRILL